MGTVSKTSEDDHTGDVLSILIDSESQTGWSSRLMSTTQPDTCRTSLLCNGADVFSDSTKDDRVAFRIICIQSQGERNDRLQLPLPDEIPRKRAGATLVVYASAYRRNGLEHRRRDRRARRVRSIVSSGHTCLLTDTNTSIVTVASNHQQRPTWNSFPAIELH